MNKAKELSAMLKAADRLAIAMKKKLKRKAREGRAGGLHPENRANVAQLLREHVDRLIGGCPDCGHGAEAERPQAIDVANLAMMLWVMPETPEVPGRPCIVLSKSGQKTDKPKVHISAHSKHGMATIMTCNDDVQGNAQVQLYGDTYSKILCVPLLDNR